MTNLTEAQRARLEPLDEGVAMRVARIIGAPCAASRALDELRRRRSAGEAVRLFTGGGSIFVGPDWERWPQGARRRGNDTIAQGPPAPQDSPITFESIGEVAARIVSDLQARRRGGCE
jgi:hypothetical protein